MLVEGQLCIFCKGEWILLPLLIFSMSFYRISQSKNIRAGTDSCNLLPSPCPIIKGSIHFTKREVTAPGVHNETFTKLASKARSPCSHLSLRNSSQLYCEYCEMLWKIPYSNMFVKCYRSYCFLLKADLHIIILKAQEVSQQWNLTLFLNQFFKHIWPYYPFCSFAFWMLSL